ncbi:MAG: prephenate dehydratase [Deltaproteobacteria bacterium]|nr:prephenate dehydratase [Deltaproteobacteria bacterium]
MKATSLEGLRAQLKKIDRDIVRLFNRRAEMSQVIGKFKKDNDIDIYDPAQEARVLRYLGELNEGPLPEASLKTIFREIISTSRALQKPIEVAYFGLEASFTHLAAKSHFGDTTRYISQPQIGRVFTAVEKGEVDWGVVPRENSLEGSVNMTLDQLFSTSLKIRAEIFLRISHCLISAEDHPDAVKTVYSHPQALAQCQRWLRENLPHAVVTAVDSTSAAAKMVSEKAGAAAIGSLLAAQTYGLKIISRGIEDYPMNVTRFFVIGKGESQATGKDKTSILFGTPNVPGALYHTLKPFADRGLNMAKIESYPTKVGPWEFVFFVDVEGHQEDQEIRICLEEMKSKSTLFKILGSYPRGEEVL